ncbi:winged helix-turn-helix domain-containing protein [Sphingomonas colocasiae]|uniref:Winged helix-turn-helix domain-containing protein n=1 Tax=Sphingomonas colocasiae TaxID=1848973 RepID=A0ABS7PYG8_9SPHN|nr:winged helix-turn-helix domain-containing protein [Sphingomonas colocasiae]
MTAPLNPNNLMPLPDFSLGGATISPSTRNISGPAGRIAVEPRMMQVLIAMAEVPGGLVTRESLLERCWGGAVVGDDSLNRAVAGLRRALGEAVGEAVRIETISGAGYRLTVAEVARDSADDAGDRAIDSGWQSWKLGLPVVDDEAIARLRAAAAAQPGRADVPGMLALVLRNAAEYADLAQCPALVRECELAAAQALARDPRQIHARAALIGLPPLYGDWTARRAGLCAALAENPDNFAAEHDLCMLEMATGRPSVAAAISSRLMAIDPLTATLHYKQVYQLWSVGDLAGMDRIGDRGMQLWPRHPAIWLARLWSLAFTGRVRQAIQQLRESEARPDLPQPAIETFAITLDALADRDDRTRHARAVERNLRAAELGPAQSLAATIHLSGLGEAEAALSVAEGYFLRRGTVSVGVYKTVSDPSVTDQHRRVTQMLFLPVCAPLRAHPHFARLCADMGLSAYWESAGIAPDFLDR